MEKTKKSEYDKELDKYLGHSEEKVNCKECNWKGQRSELHVNLMGDDECPECKEQIH